MARDWKTTYAASAAAAQHTGTFTQAAIAGHGLVAIAAAPATIAVPAGWSEHADPLGTGELSVASRTAAGGETSVVWDRDSGQSTAPRTLAGWIESRDDVGALNGTPLSFAAAVSGSVPGGFGIDLGSITTTVAGCRIYVAVAQVDPGSAWTPTWSAGLTGEDVFTAAGGGFEAVRLAVASMAAPAAGAYPIVVTNLPNGQTFQAAVFALAPATPAEEPPAAATIIEAENRLTGVAKSTWDITGAGSMTIQGYATATSVNRGSTLNLKVHSPAAAWTGTVYRLGYYAGDGARQVATISGPQTTQPTGTVDPVTLMTSCANWAVNGSWAVPADATPGVYLIRVARNDNATLASHIGPFVVTNPARKAPITVRLSDSTWQAYNHAGPDPADLLTGRSVYGLGTPSGFTFNQAQRARAVSYDRPLVTRQHLPQTSFWNAEYPLLRWLERCGYDVDYLSCAQVDADPTLLLGRKTVISSGHDEYWSQGMWDAHTAARDHATTSSHLLFLSGNEAFWRINWASGHRSYACWKDSHDGNLNASGVYSGTWQDTRGFNPLRRPAALLNGQRFRLNGISAYPLAVPAAMAGLPLWRHTAVAALGAGQTWTSPTGIVGFEADEPADTSLTEKPTGLVRLSQVSHQVTGMLADDDGNTYTGSGTYTHAITGYRAATGAAVFATGTVQYAWGLDDVHDRHPGGTLASPVLQQALTNLLADLGTVPPAYPLPDDLTLPTGVALTAYGFPDTSTPTGAPVYVSLAVVKQMLGKLTVDDRDDLIEQAIAAASRQIDSRCGRHFYADTVASTRTFPVIGRAGYSAGEQVIHVDDIASLTDLAVATGSTGAWTSTIGWEAGPDNALVYGRPFTQLYGRIGWLPATGRVQITARWGWPAVPPEITQATALLAVRLYRRKDSPQGVIGSAEWGAVRVSRTDPDVEALIAPFVVPVIA